VVAYTTVASAPFGGPGRESRLKQRSSPSRGRLRVGRRAGIGGTSRCERAAYAEGPPNRGASRLQGAEGRFRSSRRTGIQTGRSVRVAPRSPPRGRAVAFLLAREPADPRGGQPSAGSTSASAGAAARDASGTREAQESHGRGQGGHPRATQRTPPRRNASRTAHPDPGGNGRGGTIGAATRRPLRGEGNALEGVASAGIGPHCARTRRSRS
jgi:hypothetical protein